MPLHYFRRSTGARGKAMMRAAAADQAENEGLEGDIRGKLLGVRCKSRFYRGKISTAIDVAVSPSLAAVDIDVYLLCGTVEVCVVFLDTLTPMFELYVRLKERR
ncbi:hypothetical protein Taro_020833 [Colocasia esculenta]|uniref:Uncharacterized protein n=1 Tax=Colocasia esculenta TaxID=4460 RepID=A0A843V0Q7_COLES|nr:hypothetical protein [Colocasia esculenta]